VAFVNAHLTTIFIQIKNMQIMARIPMSMVIK
jgi:hypothetical protein